MPASPLRRTIAVATTAAALLVPANSATATTNATDPISDESLIIDDADLLDDERVVDALNNLERTQGSTTQIAVFTTDEVTKDDYDQAVTEELVERDPDGIIAHGDLEPDVVVVTISPEVRQMGIYSGKDSPSSQPVTEGAIETMRPFARDEDWDNVAFTGALEYLAEHDLVDEPNKATSTGPNSTSTLYVIIIMLTLLALVALGLVFAAVSNARENRRRGKREKHDIEQFRLTHTKQDIDRTLDTWSSVRETAKAHPRAIMRLLSLSQEETDHIVTQLRLIRASHYQPSPEMTRDPDLVRALQDHDTSRITQLTQTSGQHAQDVLDSMHDVARELTDVIEEARSMDLPEKPLTAITRRNEKAVERILTLVTEVEERVTSPVAGLEDVLVERSHALSFAEDVIRHLSQDERAEVTQPRRSGLSDSRNQTHLWPAYTAIFIAASGSTATSSASSTSSSVSNTASTSSVSSFSGGGFSGGSGGF